MKNSYGIFSNPGKHESLYKTLPDGIEELVEVVQNLMVHPMEAELYNLKFSSSRVREEEQLRSIEQILDAICKINPEPLINKRINEDKIIGICRDHVLLFISMLQYKGITARARVGFASYFDSEIEYETHWVAEYFNENEKRWILVDPQLDKFQIEKHQIKLNRLDVPNNAFYTAGKAWKESVSKNIKPEDFGFNKKWRGWSTIKSSLIQDLLCLNNIEPLAWDFWGDLISKGFSNLTKQDKELLEEMAEKTFDTQLDLKSISSFYNSLNLKEDVESALKLINLNKQDIDVTENLKPSIFDDIFSLEYKIGENLSENSTELNLDINKNDIHRDDEIIIRGARQNNLKNVDISVPKNRMTVVTGVSGSGKSSLAFDTIYAEGRRRYMASLSAYARRFVDTLEKPDLDHIIGVHPAIAIEQKTISRNPRSTVGSISEIYDYLRVLFAQKGLIHCPVCGDSIESFSSKIIARKLINQDYINSINIENQTIDLKSVDEKSLISILDKEFKKGNGLLKIESDSKIFTFSNELKCHSCNIKAEAIRPAMFNQNSIDGFCPECSGLGKKMEVDPEKIVEFPDKSLLDGASSWFGILRKKKKNANWMVGEMYALAEFHNVDLDKTWNQYPEQFRSEVLYGNRGQILEWEYTMGKAGRSGTISRAAVGAIYNINRLFRGTSSEDGRERLSQFLKESPCPVCKGEKIGPIARLVTLGNKRYPQVASMTIKEISSWLKSLKGDNNKAVTDLITDMENRIGFLVNVGLHYLGLDRTAPSLSGGEGQRIRLATQLGSGLSGILYVLDEPSIGLHPRDHRPLIKAMKELSEGGNTVLVVEHNRETILAADTIIDVGPGAGINGGSIVCKGAPKDIIADINSITGSFLKDIKNVRHISSRDIGKRNIKLLGATLNNLKNVDLEIPLGNFVGISGVSGSGKSSLISKTLVPAIESALSKKEYISSNYSELHGTEHIENIINVTQEPIGRTPRSNPATYVDILDNIRDIFAATEFAKKKKLDKKYFSFNSKNGSCPECGGLGKKKVEMNFMPDTYSQCPDCEGKRYNRKVLEVMWKGYNIADILDMDIDEAEQLFRDYPVIDSMLKTLQDVGLGYIKLGQNALTFSGGEAQRIKLAKELCKNENGKSLYILDEPTTGLHFIDVKKLLVLLQKLVDAGNTVIVIEHNMDVLSSTDWIIDLGPDGGDKGGYIIAQGTPLEVSKSPESVTGKYIKDII